jgi:putative oxygen-independent coproporphyrinogen III oxidase
MSGLYLHIPFCASRCIYCGFYSTTNRDLQDRYVEMLCKEMEIRKQYLAESGDNQISTVYLGGGTPSQLSAANLDKLFNTIDRLYGISGLDEVTMECNPDDVTPQYAEILKRLPVNRVSMGAQSFSDKRLKFLRRRHTSQEVEQAVDLLKGIGISNISIDLIFGFPNETIEEWTTDIERAIGLDVKHLSAYSLMYEEGTPLYRMKQQGELKEIDEDTSLQMYNELIDRLTAAGFEHYEISNFAIPGYRSKHNSSYWHAIPYIGIGASAHSYDKKSRQWNISDINKYMETIEKGNIPMECELLDDDTKYDDLVTTALRTIDGIDLLSLDSVHKDYLMDNARQYIDRKLMEVKDNKLRLTRSGLFISDTIMSDLMKI